MISLRRAFAATSMASLVATGSIAQAFSADPGAQAGQAASTSSAGQDSATAAPAPWTMCWGMRIWGAKAGGGYNGIALLPGRSTTLEALVSSAYETLDYGRDSSGMLESPDSAEADAAAYEDWDTEWSAGISRASSEKSFGGPDKGLSFLSGALRCAIPGLGSRAVPFRHVEAG